MPEEQIKNAINQAAGNNMIEGHDVTEDEKNLILRIFQEYKGNYGDKAIDSLLYGLVTGVKDMKEEKNHVQYKK